MIEEKKFDARTRKRGEIDYYMARWVYHPKVRGKYAVMFLEGPHKGEKFEAIEVAKSK